jgi:5-(carboxyamino)imidazole ribonucleotide synthase
MPEAGLFPPLPPGSTIGILGSGQLGRMLAIAAARLGFKAHIYCEASGPAFDVAASTTKAAFDDKAALTAFAGAVDVVTYEFENVPIATARHLNGQVPVLPTAKALEVAQDRLLEKQFISGLGIPVAAFRAVGGPDELRAALADIGAPAVLKTRRLGYDGKGQAGLHQREDAEQAWAAVGSRPSVLEKRIDFACEISVLAVRSRAGDLAFYDSPVNTHEKGILRRSVVPSRLPAADLELARRLAGRIAVALDYVGVLAVEMFHLGSSPSGSERLMVNEIAPRVHNSGHWTIEACMISQFENHVRAVAGWPLGATDRHSDAEMINLIGREVRDWQMLAADPGVALHLYGKRDPRDGRKMGHVTRLAERKA